jgi:hypothetical protein
MPKLSFHKGPFLYKERGAEKRADGRSVGRRSAHQDSAAHTGGVRIPKGLFAALLFLLDGAAAVPPSTLYSRCAAWLSLSVAALLSLCRLLFSFAKSRAEAAIDVVYGPSPQA